MSIGYVVEVLLLISVVLAGCIYCGSFVYDMRDIYMGRLLRGRVRKLRFPRQPQVTIIIPITHSVDGLDDCLRALRYLQYRRFDIVIAVVSTTTKSERQYIRRSIVAHSPFSIRYFAKRSKSDTHQLLAGAYDRSQKGEYVLTLTPEDRLSPGSLKCAVAWMMLHPGRAGVYFAVDRTFVINMTSVSLWWAELSTSMCKKALPLRRSGGSTGLYRKENFLHQCRTARPVVVWYLSRAAVTTSAGMRMRPVGYLLLFLSLLIVGYSSVVAVRLLTPAPLLISWLIATIWFGIIIWSNEALQYRRRFDLSFLLPISYFAVPLGLLIRAVVRDAKR